MAKHRNCPNCGAPYEVELSRCPYCGTAYFDLSTIDIDDHEPFFMKMKCNGMLITQLVVPMAAKLEMTRDDVSAIGSYGTPIARFTRSCNVETNLALTAIPFRSELAGGEEVLCLAETAE